MSLADRPRPGRPPTFGPLQRAEIKALACQLPAESGVPMSRWSCGNPAREAVARGLAAAISASTVRLWPPTRSSPGSTVVDPHPGLGLRGQGRPRAGPVRPRLGRPPARRG
ncbi:helix-turn-helix domain-containing protein [Streptomyces sp. NBC_01207]|nr:helix-turn-helix domain-containing protein [Streptomyces sp. NBC_01207]